MELEARSERGSSLIVQHATRAVAFKLIPACHMYATLLNVHKKRPNLVF